MKENERQKIQNLYKKIIEIKKETSLSIAKIAKNFNLSKNQVEKILNGRSTGKQVRGFPKFDSKFINTYCLFKTPLNDETLSDVIRQTTTCQVSKEILK